MKKYTIRVAAYKNIPALQNLLKAGGKSESAGYFERNFELQAQGQRQLFVIGDEGENCLAGYCILNYAPRYAFFQKLDIPEIQDLNVAPLYRNQGLATSLIAHCEALIREKSGEYMGIGVGLDRSYGAAQRLYVRLGYIPDGNGVTYDRELVARYSLHPIDDELSLMMVKSLT